MPRTPFSPTSGAGAPGSPRSGCVMLATAIFLGGPACASTRPGPGAPRRAGRRAPGPRAAPHRPPGHRAARDLRPRCGPDAPGGGGLALWSHTASPSSCGSRASTLVRVTRSRAPRRCDDHRHDDERGRREGLALLGGGAGSPRKGGALGDPAPVLGEWAPPPGRRDPVDLLEEQATTRVPELVPSATGGCWSRRSRSIAVRRT